MTAHECKVRYNSSTSSLFSIECSIESVRLNRSDDDDKLNSYSTKEKKQKKKKKNKSLDWQRQGEQKADSCCTTLGRCAGRASPREHSLDRGPVHGLVASVWGRWKDIKMKNKVHRVLESSSETRDPSGVAEIESR